MAGPLFLLLAVQGIAFWGLILASLWFNPSHGSAVAFGMEIPGVLHGLGMTPIVVAVYGALGVLGYGFLMEEPWAQPLGALYGVGAGLASGVAVLLSGAPWIHGVTSLLWGILVSGVCAAHLYRKPAVVAYYGAMGSRGRA